ncbi:transaldolase family protein [Neobacillus niacini]|uniref:transaldolase family protein n=1 Tax=Neobacillus niacini TaxID=86668 RepID=UPI003000C947
MKYFIDSANVEEITHLLELGVVAGITANPSLYEKQNTNFYDFLRKYSTFGIMLTAEVVGDDLFDLIRQVEKITKISKDIIIKLNYSQSSLKLVKILKEKGIKTAITLVFDMNQAMLAINAGVDYVFLFVARNEEMGVDGLTFVENVAKVIEKKRYSTHIIAASIRTKYQLDHVALFADYIAAPFKLIEESFNHPLTLSGKQQFEADMKRILSPKEENQVVQLQ